MSSPHLADHIDGSLDIGLWSARIDGGRIQASQGLYRILGLDPARACSYTFLDDMMHPEDRRELGPITPLLRRGQTVRREFRVVRPDQSECMIRCHAEVIVDEVGRPNRLHGVIEDETRRRATYGALEIDQDRLSKLIDTTATVVWVATANGRYLDTPQWRALTGQTHEQMQGSGWLWALHPKDRSRAEAAWATAVAHVSPYNTDYRVLCRDGISRWFNARGAPLLNPDGTVREWVGVCLAIPGWNGPIRYQPARTDMSHEAETSRITPSQIRAARALTDMTAEEVARQAGISAHVMHRIEAASAAIPAKSGLLRMVRQVFERAGVVFTFHPTPGVRMA
ncbi:PAS domain-containing protein [Methylobacterium komagatae]